MMKIPKKGKGQMSFDLAFAITLILIILGMVQSFTDSTKESTENGRTLMALNMLADYSYGNLNSFYNSLVGAETNASYQLDFPNDVLFSSVSTDDYSGVVYAVDVTNLGTNPIMEFSEPTTSLDVEREFAFAIECTIDSWTSASPGDSLYLEDCSIKDSGTAPRDLLCGKCEII